MKTQAVRSFALTCYTATNYGVIAMDEVINVLLDRHNEDKNQCLAWCLGYIDRLERDQNTMRKALGYSEEQRLLDDLREDV